MIHLASPLLLAGTFFGPVALQEQEIRLPLEDERDGWHAARIIEDGARGRAVSFENAKARIDVGACPVSSTEPFTLIVYLRTRAAGFSTPLMARRGGRVGLSLVMGRRPGCISFEAWSWTRVKLISKTRVDDGRWHRIEVPYDPAANCALLFVDGKLQASGPLGEGSSPNARLRLGNNIGADQPFPGDLDEVAVLRRTTHLDRAVNLRPVLSAKQKASELAALRKRLLQRTTPSLADLNAKNWERRRSEIRRRLADALGLDPPPARGPLEPKIHGAIAGQGLRVQRLSYGSWPGYRATGWLWLPEPKPRGKLPAILGPHGHWQNGALNPVVQARAARFAKEGYIALMVDSVHVEDAASGVSSIGAMTWNNIRAIDYLLERDDVDPTRIGITGASGGAQQTMYLMALENRIAAAAPICMISYFGEIITDRSAHCGCNHAYRVGHFTDEPELCAVFAPSPVFFGSVTGDWTKNFPKEGLPEIRRLYERLGHPERVKARHMDAGHNYDRPFREQVYGFFDALFLKEKETDKEQPFKPLPRERLLALGPPPRRPPDRALMAKEHRARRPKVTSLRELAPGLPWKVKRASLRDLGALADGSPWRKLVVTAEDGVGIPCLWRQGSQKPSPWLIVVPANGKGPFLLDPPAWLGRFDRVVVVDPRFRGEWHPFASAWRRNGLLLGRGEGYQAAHDVALVAGSLPGDAPVALIGLGSAGVEALIAATLTDRIERVVAPDIGPRFAENGNRAPLCPEILRFGDLPELAAAIRGARRVTIGGAGSTDSKAPRALSLRVRRSVLTEDDIFAALHASR